MLFFVGLGISGFDSLSLAGKEIIQKADVVFLEEFTSPIPEDEISKLKTLAGNEFKILKRWMVEDGKEILDAAKQKDVVLLSYGDPYIATTHQELRTRAIQNQIKIQTIHNSSALTAMVGESGLHFYKIGKIATLMSDVKTISSVYYSIYHNLSLGLHTVLLLEYDQDRKFFLSPNEALKNLLAEEKEQRRNIIKDSTFVIVASRIGLQNQKIVVGKIDELINLEFGNPPHSLIIPGIFHFTELDALIASSESINKPKEDGNKIQNISHQMIQKYVPMVEKSLEEIKPHYEKLKEFESILENARLYIKDSQKFLEKGQDELAILSIGYADGLVDALRIAKGFEPKL